MQALLDALFGERFEDVVDDSEVEGFQGVLREGGRKHEHRRRRLTGHRANQVETGARISGGGQLNIGEEDVHRRPGQRLASLLERRAPRPHAVRRVVARRKKSLVFLDPEKIWAFEAADRLTFVHSSDGKFDIDLSLAAIEASFGRALFRVHRNWLVNLLYVKELDRDIGGLTVTVGSDLDPEGPSIHAPVSQDRAKALRDVLLENTTGLRKT